MAADGVDKAIEHAARQLSIDVPDVAAGKGKAYEVWVLLAVVRRLAAAKVIVQAVDCKGVPTRSLIVRKNPAAMPSESDATGKAPGHFVLWQFGSAAELHLGLQHQGLSGSTHELDISLIPGRSGAELRKAGGGFYRDWVCIALELKAYDKKHKLDQTIARSLVGTMADLQPFRFADFSAVLKDGKVSLTWRDGAEPAKIAIVTTTSLFDNSKLLLAGHSGSCHEGVEPRSNEDELRKIALMVREAWCR